MKKELSISKAILDAVNAVVADPWYFVKLWAFWILLGMVWVIFSALGLFILAISKSLVAVFIIALLCLLFYVYFYFFTQKILLAYVDGQDRSLSLGKLISEFDFSLSCKLLLAVLLQAVLIGSGLILLIIPGIFLAIRLMFTFILLIDTRCGVIEAFSQSFGITRGNFWRLFGLYIITYMLMSLIITVPVSMLMLVYAYRQLKPAA